jgi:hypothetical protein
MAIHVQSALIASHAERPKDAWGRTKRVFRNLLDDLRHAYFDARTAEQEARKRFTYVFPD